MENHIFEKLVLQVKNYKAKWDLKNTIFLRTDIFLKNHFAEKTLSTNKSAKIILRVHQIPAFPSNNTRYTLSLTNIGCFSRSQIRYC